MKHARARVKTDDNTTVVLAEGDFDLSTIGLLRQTLLQATAEQKAPGRIIVDMSGVTFADSTAIGVIIGAHKRVEAHGGVLSVVLPPGSTVRKVFELTGLTQLITTYGSFHEAAASDAA